MHPGYFLWKKLYYLSFVLFIKMQSLLEVSITILIKKAYIETLIKKRSEFSISKKLFSVLSIFNMRFFYSFQTSFFCIRFQYLLFELVRTLNEIIGFSIKTSISTVGWINVIFALNDGQIMSADPALCVTIVPFNPRIDGRYTLWHRAQCCVRLLSRRSLLNVRCSNNRCQIIIIIIHLTLFPRLKPAINRGIKILFQHKIQSWSL